MNKKTFFLSLTFLTSCMNTKLNLKDKCLFGRNKNNAEATSYVRLPNETQTEGESVHYGTFEKEQLKQPQQEEQQNKALLSACSRGNLATVKDLLVKYPKINLNCSDQYHHTPLSFAVVGKHTDIIKLLIKSGADVNYIPVPETQSVLHLASERRGASDIIKILLKAGADPNKKTHYGLSPLNLAIDFRDLSAVKALIEYNADINYLDNRDRTALMYAAEAGDTRIVSYLLSQKSIILDHSDIRAYDALMYAVSNKHTAVVEQLLKAGFRIEKPIDTIDIIVSPLQIPTNKKTRKMLNSAFEKQEKLNSK